MENGFKNSQKRFRKLIFEVILCVEGDIILEHEDWVFGALKELIPLGTFDDDIRNAITQCWCRT